MPVYAEAVVKILMPLAVNWLIKIKEINSVTLISTKYFLPPLNQQDFIQSENC
jgi:hypothetical protein